MATYIQTNQYRQLQQYIDSFPFLSILYQWIASRNPKREYQFEIPSEGSFSIGPHIIYLTKLVPSNSRLNLEVFCILDFDREYHRRPRSNSSLSCCLAISATSYRKYMFLKQYPSTVNQLLVCDRYLSRIKWCQNLFQAYRFDLESFYICLQER